MRLHVFELRRGVTRLSGDEFLGGGADFGDGHFLLNFVHEFLRVGFFLGFLGGDGFHPRFHVGVHRNVGLRSNVHRGEGFGHLAFGFDLFGRALGCIHRIGGVGLRDGFFAGARQQRIQAFGAGFGVLVGAGAQGALSPSAWTWARYMADRRSRASASSQDEENRSALNFPELCCSAFGSNKGKWVASLIQSGSSFRCTAPRMKFTGRGWAAR